MLIKLEAGPWSTSFER